MTLLLPICSTLLQGAELADAAQPLFKSMASTAAPQPIPAEVDEASSKATPEAPLSAPPLPTPIQTMKSLAQGSFHHSVAPVSPMVSGTPSHADPKWSALRARIPGLVHPTPSASSSAPAPAPTQTSAVVSIRTPGTEVTSVVSSIMAKRRAILGQSSSGSPLPARPSPAAVPRAPPGPPPPKPKTADVSNRCGEVDLILAAFAAVYRHKDLTTESQVVALLQRRLLPVAIRVLSDCLHGFSHSSVASATGNTLPGIQALMGALLESYFIGTLSPVSQGWLLHQPLQSSSSGATCLCVVLQRPRNPRMLAWTYSFRLWRWYASLAFPNLTFVVSSCAPMCSAPRYHPHLLTRVPSFLTSGDASLV